MYFYPIILYVFLSHHTVVWGILSFLRVIFFVCTVTDFSAAEKKIGAWNFACVLNYYPDRSSPILEVKCQVTRDKKRHLQCQHPHGGVRMVCARCDRRSAAAADERISWRPRGDVGCGVHRGSLGDSELRTTLAGHSELGAAASTKAVWWDLRLASLL